MPARTPVGRASYEAAVTTPRRDGSPHTITGWPRRCGCFICSTEAKKASMSTSRIMGRSSTAPCLAEDPARTSRVVAKLVDFRAGPFDREEAEAIRAFAPTPLPRHLAHADDPPLPAKA